MIDRSLEKARWLLGHLRRTTTRLPLPISQAEVSLGIAGSLRDPFEPGLGKAARSELRQSGFVTGELTVRAEQTTFRLKGYRPGVWLGRLQRGFDPDALAKPALVGVVTGNSLSSEIQYRVDAFGTAISSVVLALLGLPLLLAGISLLLADPFPMPNLGFLLSVCGGVCLIFLFLIWQVVDHAVLDEEFLDDWLRGLFADRVSVEIQPS